MNSEDQRLVRRSVVDAPAAELFAWHDRPGALQRLTPPWERVRVEQQASTLEPGSRVVFRAGMGPLPDRFGIRWVAEHVEYDPPRSFRDVQRSGPFPRWDHTHRVEDMGGDRSAIIDEVTYRLPLGRLGERIAGPAVRSRLDRMFDYRHRQTVADVATHAAARRKGAPLMKVAVTGASGLIGTALTSFLTTGGHEVLRLVRRPPRGPGEVQWDPAGGTIDAAALSGVDAVVHLAGEPIASSRWTGAQKRRILTSRTAGTGLMAETLARLDDGPRILVCASGTHYYGDRGDAELTEDSPPGDGFLPEVVSAWEAAADPAREAGVRVAHLRTGIVLSAAGGALPKLLPLFRLGLGGRFGSGRQWWSWAGLDDVVGAYHHALTSAGLSGPVNVTAPAPARNAELTAVLARVVSRPALLPVPAFGPKLLLGELADSLLFDSMRVLPERLAADGYTFRHPTLEGALRHALGRPAA